MSLSREAVLPWSTNPRFPQDSGFIADESLIFGSTDEMQALRLQVRSVARSDVPVLIQGESGSGKDVFSRIIHKLSPFANGPFVKVSCPAIPPTLFENELFGHEKGSFTGAIGNKAGRVALAQGGTLFLDEIGELPLAVQAKLLQVLQDGKFCPIGGSEEKKVEVRIICATNRNLESAIANGDFREDLFYRINVVNLKLVPLRDRRADIPELAQHFLDLYNDKYNRKARALSPKTTAEMQQYSWPGNIRQLENLIKRYVVLGSEDSICTELKQNHSEEVTPASTIVVPTDRPISLKKITKQAVREIEKRVISQVMQANDGDCKRTARLLNISYRALHYKMKEADIPSKRRRLANLRAMQEGSAVQV